MLRFILNCPSLISFNFSCFQIAWLNYIMSIIKKFWTILTIRVFQSLNIHVFHVVNVIVIVLVGEYTSRCFLSFMLDLSVINHIVIR